MNNIKQLIKRDGTSVSFNGNKILNAIRLAFHNFNIRDEALFLKITKEIIDEINSYGKPDIHIEKVQDLVEKYIGKYDHDVSIHYHDYRLERTREREKNHRIYKKVENILKITSRENANVGNGPSAKLLQIAEVTDREFAENFLIRKEIKEAMDANIIYPHDFSWYGVGTLTCCFIPLGKLLEKGFESGHGFIRPPKRIKSAASLACIIFQSNQNEMHGGQAFGWFDRDMAPYVRLEYVWQIENIKEDLLKLGISSIDEKEIKMLAWDRTRKETYQAMEALVFNLNTMHSRAGSQIPFTSINFGLDTSIEGRLVSEMLLLAYEKGLGKGEQPLFPNLIFNVKEGVNWEEDSPNHDLLKLSLRVSSTRLFPNYVFQDASLNKDYVERTGESIPVMGCRTRISTNVRKGEDGQTVVGRGNTSFTTINLPRIALDASHKVIQKTVSSEFEALMECYDIKLPEVYAENELIGQFFCDLNQTIDLVITQLLDRLEYQGRFVRKDFPFLMNGVWMDSEHLKRGEPLKEVIKHGTLSIGFIGLAETLKVLTGYHHGEDADVNILGECMISFMRKRVDEATLEYNLNFSLLATPAEGLCEKLVKRDQRDYGEVAGVTDKKWYTNSFHVPVEYKVSLFKKIEIEGRYHKYCNAGNISYVELKESPVDNPNGMLDILRHMKENDMSYVAINFPIDRCIDCGEKGYFEETCVKCGSEHISRVRRITGYLAELDNFNQGKLAEAKSRVSHCE